MVNSETRRDIGIVLEIRPVANLILIKGGKFLKKRDSEADVSSVSPSSERIKELWVVCGLYTEIWSYAIGWCLAT